MRAFRICVCVFVIFLRLAPVYVCNVVSVHRFFELSVFIVVKTAARRSYARIWGWRVEGALKVGLFSDDDDEAAVLLRPCCEWMMRDPWPPRATLVLVPGCSTSVPLFRGFLIGGRLLS